MQQSDAAWLECWVREEAGRGGGGGWGLGLGKVHFCGGWSFITFFCGVGCRGGEGVHFSGGHFNKFLERCSKQ